MQQFKRSLFRYAKGFKTTVSLDNDVKLVKKLNNLIAKYLRYGKEQKYLLEIINILKVLENQFIYSSGLRDLILNMFIDTENKSTFIEVFDDFK